jgi:hypothetical protein
MGTKKPEFELNTFTPDYKRRYINSSMTYLDKNYLLTSRQVNFRRGGRGVTLRKKRVSLSVIVILFHARIQTHPGFLCG